MFDFLHHPWLQNYKKWKNKKMWAGTYSSSDSSSSSGEESINNLIDQHDEEEELKVAED